MSALPAGTRVRLTRSVGLGNKGDEGVVVDDVNLGRSFDVAVRFDRLTRCLYRDEVEVVDELLESDRPWRDEDPGAEAIEEFDGGPS